LFLEKKIKIQNFTDYHGDAAITDDKCQVMAIAAYMIAWVG